MSAPEGNKFWELRSKHGRDKIFSTPDDLWQAACEYFEWSDDNPWIEEDWVGKDGDKVEKKHPRPFTLSGLCIYLDCGEETLRRYGKEKEYKDYWGVYTRIEQIIRTQKFEGAATGFFNANIIARDLGLTDKTEAKNEITGKDGGDINVTLNIT